MSENKRSELCRRNRSKQPISVPFLWEEKPGRPKKDWKPSGVEPSSSATTTPITTTTNPVVSTPLIKLVASVPFVWEEKPGKPRPAFFLPPPESTLLLTAPSELINYLPSAGKMADDGVDDEEDESFESDLEEFGFETDESFSSAPSLLANCVVSSNAISRAIPVEQIPLSDFNSGQLLKLETPPSPGSESDSSSSTSSYATGTTSLVGASFLERLFPLLLPSSSFLQKQVGRPPQKLLIKDDDDDDSDPDKTNNNSFLATSGPTLGELIMMSRKRSYLRKAAQMRNQKNVSMDFVKTNAVGCCIFGTGNNTRRLHSRWKRQLQLKLMQ